MCASSYCFDSVSVDLLSPAPAALHHRQHRAARRFGGVFGKVHGNAFEHLLAFSRVFHVLGLVVAGAKNRQLLLGKQGFQHLEQAVGRDTDDLGAERVVEDMLVDLELALQPVLGQGVFNDEADLVALRLQRCMGQRRQQAPGGLVFHPAAKLERGLVAQLLHFGHRRLEPLAHGLVVQLRQRPRAAKAMLVQQVHHQRVHIGLGHGAQAKLQVAFQKLGFKSSHGGRGGSSGSAATLAELPLPPARPWCSPSARCARRWLASLPGRASAPPAPAHSPARSRARAARAGPRPAH